MAKDSRQKVVQEVQRYLSFDMGMYVSHRDSEMENCMEKLPFCREPYAVKAARTVLTGGTKETCRKVTRLVPTH
jgi:hypothetical protein